VILSPIESARYHNPPTLQTDGQTDRRLTKGMRRYSTQSAVTTNMNVKRSMKYRPK